MQSEPEILPRAPAGTAFAAPPPRPRRWGLHVGLFVATFLSAMWFQSIDWAQARSWEEAVLGPWRDPTRLAQGFVFAGTLLSILLAHEMGHFLTARLHHVDQTLPYFIPAPTLFGTLGALILMRSQPANRSVLLRVAVAGPFAGLLVAVPAAMWGLAHSTPTNAVPDAAEPILGSSFLWGQLVLAFAPHDGAAFVDLHPVAFAAWAGLLVTAINLIPAAQLDGGHIAYALFGPRHLGVSRAVVVLLVVVGLLMNGGTLLSLEGPGTVWLVWAALLALFGLRHPPVRDETATLSRAERAAGWLALLLFLLTFVPQPLVREPAFPVAGPELEERFEQPHGGGRRDAPLPEEYRL